MNENTGNSKYGFFYDLLDNPADLAHSKAANLQLLVNEFPQSGLLRSMLAVKPDEENLQSASAYVNPKLLYIIANAAASLRTVSEEQIVVCQAPGEASAVLPIPVGVELPNLDIDESNYFHVPIDDDLVYIDDETADVEQVESDVNSEDANDQAGTDEAAAAVIEEDTTIDSDETVENEIEANAEIAPPLDEDVVITEEDKPSVQAVPSGEADIDVAEESHSLEDAAPLSEIDTEGAEESETEEDTVPSLEFDTIAVEASETETIPSSDNDTEVIEKTEAEEDTPLSESDLEIAGDNSEETQSNTDRAEPAEEFDENHIQADVSSMTSGETGEIFQDEQQPELPAEQVEESPEEIQQEAEENVPQLFVQTNESETDTNISDDHESVPSVEEADEPVGEEGNSNIGAKPMQADQEIDDEVFEEIVSIEDIGLEQLAIMDKAVIADEGEHSVTDDSQSVQTPATGDSYFVFEPALPEDDERQAPSMGITAENATVGQERQHVSRYNDEKMPYSFMWWLDKTRKEHAAIYQPFATGGKFHTETVTAVEKPQPAADHLQQQYVENIFAVSAAVSDLNVIPPKADTPPAEKKADKIIEKFIHEEPQIKHPSKAKLDSENKAKKSSEDRDELVTETLAKIYTEQMLYHKAILTYKKLMLKFPEKSLYFAGQIEQLENKIN